MDYKLDREISIRFQSTRNSLYAWCLHESDKEGRTINDDLIPFRHSLFFTASSLRVTRNTTLRIESEDESNFTSKSSQSTTIYGTLYSGYHAKDGGRLLEEVPFFMMGTGRRIDKFHLSILATNEGTKDLCSVVAIPRALELGITDDYLGFEMSLNKDLFSELVRAIESNSANEVTMIVSGVNGFYSEWSPTINTNYISVLSKQIKIEGVGDSGITPPSAGLVENCILRVEWVDRLNLQNGFSLDQNSVEFVKDKIFSSADSVPDVDPTADRKSDEYFRNSVAIAEKLTSSLKISLWAILGVLVLLLFK